MKKLIIFLSTFIFAASVIGQQTWTSKASGAWSSATTWSTSGGATGAPSSSLTSNRRVIITNGFVVTQASNLVLNNTAVLRIENGGKLQMGNASNPARTLTMKASGNSFYINNGTYESYSLGSGGNMLLEKGLIDWQDATVYVSGNFTIKTDVNNISMVDVCLSTAQNMLFEGAGSSSSYGTLNNVYLLAGLSGTGNFTISSSSYLTVTDIRIIVGSQSGSAEFFSSRINGSVFSIYGNQKISVSSMNGSATLNYYCANTLDPNLDFFSGNKINDCVIAQSQSCAGLSDQADLEVVKLASAETVYAGQNLTYSITVTNNGPSAAQGVMVADNLPEDISIINIMPSTGTWASPNWSIGTLEPGTTALLTFVVAPVDQFSGVLNNTATVTSTTPDPVVDNNSSTATTAVILPTAPDAINDNALTLVSTPLDINVLANDVSGTGTIIPTSVNFIPGTGPSPITQGTFTVNLSTGEVTFAPVTGFIGTVNIDYQVCDDFGLCDVATIGVNVIVGISNLYPAMGFGTLAFEDLWPSRGDYDFNDLVIDYQFEIFTNLNNNIVQVDATFVIKAIGASLHNGFGFQLSEAIDPDDLTITGNQLTENYITLNSNGTEAGQSKPTIIVFDDSFKQLQHPGSGLGINTTPGAPYVSPVTLEISIAFEPDKYNNNVLDISNFNPFLIVSQTRGIEVHLPYFPPTDLADPNLFGSLHDDTNPATGRFYVTSANLPWGINIYDNFDYPIEKQEILGAYLKFGAWAESGGVLYADWYKNLPGYRNEGSIYLVPGKK